VSQRRGIPVINSDGMPILDAGKYWIVLKTYGLAGLARNFADGTGNWYGNADSSRTAASDPFGPGNAGNGTISAYIAYRPGTGVRMCWAVPTSGHLLSSGLSASYTRWSHFNLTSNDAAVTSLHAYLDGLGGATGSQKIRMVLYHQVTDHGSTWYVKQAQSEEVTIAAGQQPLWVDFPIPPNHNHPLAGALQIAIQTGDTGGVIRDYGDNRPHPEGNWASIADTYSDGSHPDDTGARSQPRARQRDDVCLREVLDTGAVMNGGGSCRARPPHFGPGGYM